MASKIFLDANILLDLTLKREHYHTSAIIYKNILEGRFQAFTTPSIVHLMGYWLTKAYSAPKAKEIILELLNEVKVIDCSHATTINALHSSIADIEDSLQYYTGLYHQLDCLISRDRHFHKAAMPSLPIYFPEEFIEAFIEK